MSDKLFSRLLIAIVIIGAISLAALLIYTYLLYSDCSITAFIAGGR